MNEVLSDACWLAISNAIDGDIAVFRVDSANGGIALNGRYPAADNVMPLAFSAPDRTLHAATRGASPGIVSYALSAETGVLTETGRCAIDSSLAYLSVDASGEYALGASYGEDRLMLYRVGESSPLQVVENIPRAHCVIVSPDGRFAYVSSLGSDAILCFAFQPEAAEKLTLLATCSVSTGFGPRHLRLSPDAGTLYALSEFRATIASFSRDPATGRLGASVVSARAPTLGHLKDGEARNGPLADARHRIWAADLQLTPDGKTLFLSERTSSQLIGYRVEADGTLIHASSTDTETQPRGFAIDPGGRFLIACGEQSAHVSVYAIQADSTLALVARCEGGRGANWIEILAPAGIDPSDIGES